MALFDRDRERGYGYRGDFGRGRGGGFMDRAQNAVRRGWDRVEDAFEGQDVHRGGEYRGDEHLRRDYGNQGYGRGWNAGNRPMDREGGLHQRNSWSDGAWTADAAERADREWAVQNRGRTDYDRDVSPFQAGWYGPNHGGMDRDRGWNLAGGDRDWGHTGNLGGGMNRYDRGYSAGSREGGFMDRAQNAVRRGWDRVEDAFDRDDERNETHLGGASMRGGTSWAGAYDRDYYGSPGYRGYGGTMGGPAGAGRHYAADYDRGMLGRPDYDRGMLGRPDYDRGYKSREQTDTGDPFGDRQAHTPIRMTHRGTGRYDGGYRGSRDWF